MFYSDRSSLRVIHVNILAFQVYYFNIFMHFLYFVYLFRKFLCIITTFISLVFNHALALCEVLYLLPLELQLYNDSLQGCKKSPDTNMISGDGVYYDLPLRCRVDEHLKVLGFSCAIIDLGREDINRLHIQLAVLGNTVAVIAKLIIRYSGSAGSSCCV